MHFDRSAFRLFLLFLGIEIAIALWVRDRFVRPYLGDVLVIFLLFYGLKSVLRQTTAVIATAVLFFLPSVLNIYSLLKRLNGWDYPTTASPKQY